VVTLILAGLDGLLVLRPLPRARVDWSVRPDRPLPEESLQKLRESLSPHEVQAFLAAQGVSGLPRAEALSGMTFSLDADASGGLTARLAADTRFTRDEWTKLAGCYALYAWSLVLEEAHQQGSREGALVLPFVIHMEVFRRWSKDAQIMVGSCTEAAKKKVQEWHQAPAKGKERQ